jgi:hypothetical protein
VEALPAVRTRWREAFSARPLLWLTLAAIALRLLIFVGRGDYVAFDEGWYLLLARNLFDGDGYTLTGLRHVTLSPLFPILAGAVSVVLGDIIWAGRLVAAVAAGLLVWPCWHIFSRLADRRTAWLACVFVAVMPALTPFAAPYWIRWDLWVGAEPLLHLFLYAALAFALRGWQRDRPIDWALAGVALALAYLARSEAIIPLGLLGLLLTMRVVWLRTPRAALHVLALALAFGITAAPYWIYLHDALGRWTITGRGVQVTAPRRVSPRAAGATPGSAAQGIERMLWEDDQRSYMYSLYSLDASATRLSSAYWGIPDPTPAPAAGNAAPPSAPTAAGGPAAPEAASAPLPETSSGEAPRPAPGRWSLYARALAIAVPWYLWPFIAFGMLGARRAWRDELLIAAPLLLTSVAIARVVAADPRTQLFVAPLAAYYAARGIRRLGVLADRAWRRRAVRPASVRRGFIGMATAAILVFILVATEARWVYLGLSLGSPHHLVGTANRRMGEALREIVPADEPVMSWHPAIALYARRDWRVLPYAAFDRVVRYANATGTEYLVISQYYPPQGLLGELPREHVVLHVPHGAAVAGGWQIELSGGSDTHVFGRVRPAAAAGDDRVQAARANGGS